MYIASYMLKSEKGMSELLRQVSRESRGEDIKVQLSRLKTAFLNHREVSAQEAVYRILSLPLKQLSRKVVFVNSSPKEERVSMLKSPTQLEKVEEDSENIYQTSLIDRYAARPDSLEDMSLAEFAANYTTRSGVELEDGEANDALPPSEDQEKSYSRVNLKNHLGSMYKRGQEAI
jgi:plasmid maintenance system killer protein